VHKRVDNLVLLNDALLIERKSSLLVLIRLSIIELVGKRKGLKSRGEPALLGLNRRLSQPYSLFERSHSHSGP
jgi:hypothetical protein